MQWIKKLIPDWLLKSLRPVYHGSLAYIGHWWFGRPSRRLTVIGVTGTAGKSSTVQMLAKILNFAGKKTGFITTVSFFDGNEIYMNRHGLSMPGGPQLQNQLRQMVQNNCAYAIVECTSEGLAQNRHFGIRFRAALFTNLSAAHQDAHGSFENYKLAKAKLFSSLSGNNTLLGVNLDDDFANYFLSFPAANKFATTFGHKVFTGGKLYGGIDLALSPAVTFKTAGIYFGLVLSGKFNAYNALLAAACADQLGVSLADAAKALASFNKIEGRMEEILCDKGFRVFVDYAPEPAGMENALQALCEMPHKRIIHVFGSTGGHRDVRKRFEFGEISARFSDVIIITNDDVYESDPQKIAYDILQGIKHPNGYELKAKSWEMILDRRQAIKHALSIAQRDDIVIITGKGSEQFLVLPGNRRIIWDDRQVVQEELSKLPVSNP